MTKAQITKALQDVYIEQGAASFYTIEEGENGKYVVEYQLRRYVREDMAADKIDDSIQNIEQQKADMLEIKDSLNS